MKRILMMLLLVMATMGANAQFRRGQNLICTADILLRSNPSTNASVKCRLEKGEGSFHITVGCNITYLGKKQNGFCKVEVYRQDGSNSYGETYVGWAPAKYLRVRCEKCTGNGINIYGDDYGSRCTACRGRGYK